MLEELGLRLKKRIKLARERGGGQRPDDVSPDPINHEKERKKRVAEFLSQLKRAESLESLPTSEELPEQPRQPEPRLNNCIVGSLGFMTEYIRLVRPDGDTEYVAIAYDTYSTHTTVDDDLIERMDIEAIDLGFNMYISDFVKKTTFRGRKCKLETKTVDGIKCFEAVVAKDFWKMEKSCVYSIPKMWRKRYKMTRYFLVRERTCQMVFGVDLLEMWPIELSRWKGKILYRSRITGELIVCGKTRVDLFDKYFSESLWTFEKMYSVDSDEEIAETEDKESDSSGADPTTTTSDHGVTDIGHLGTAGKSNECEQLERKPIPAGRKNVDEENLVNTNPSKLFNAMKGDHGKNHGNVMEDPDSNKNEEDTEEQTNGSNSVDEIDGNENNSSDATLDPGVESVDTTEVNLGNVGDDMKLTGAAGHKVGTDHEDNMKRIEMLLREKQYQLR